MFEVYQIQLSDDDIEILELSDNWDSAAKKSPKISARLDLMGSILNHDSFSEKLEGNILSYEHFVTIDADNLNDAFRIGNDPSSRHDESKYHSLSVGDILFDNETKSWNIILSVGFADISEKFGKELIEVRNNTLNVEGNYEHIKDVSFDMEINKLFM